MLELKEVARFWQGATVLIDPEVLLPRELFSLRAVRLIRSMAKHDLQVRTAVYECRAQT